jgi:hypothetical protein
MPTEISNDGIKLLQSPLSDNELRGLSPWSDLNQDSHLDAYELASATRSNQRANDRLLTAGKGMPPECGCNRASE